MTEPSTSTDIKNDAVLAADPSTSTNKPSHDSGDKKQGSSPAKPAPLKRSARHQKSAVLAPGGAAKASEQKEKKGPVKRKRETTESDEEENNSNGERSEEEDASDRDEDKSDDDDEPRVVNYSSFPQSWSKKFLHCAEIESKLKKRVDTSKDDKKRQKKLMAEIQQKMEEVNKNRPVAVSVPKTNARFELVKKPGAMNAVTPAYVTDFLKKYFLQARREITCKEDIESLVKGMFSKEERGLKESKPRLEIVFKDS